MSRVIIMGPNRDGERVCIDPRCTTCHRFVGVSRKAKVFYQGDGDVHHFEGFRCPRCGPFEPEVECWDGDLEEARGTRA